MIADILRGTVVVLALGGIVTLEAAEKAPKKKAAAKEAKKDAGPKKDAEADADTAALLDKMDSLMYCLPKGAVKAVECKGEFAGEVPGKGTQKGGFTYTWDAKTAKGKVAFDDPSQASGARSFMPEAENLDQFFTGPIPWKKEYAGCKLTSEKQGEKTKVSVAEGRNAKGITGFVLSADGVPEEMSMAAPGMPGAGAMTVKVTYKKVGSQFVPLKISMGTGTAAPMATETWEYAAVGTYTLPAKVVRAMSMMGMNLGGTVTYAKWDLAATAKEPAKDGDSKTPRVKKSAPAKKAS
jgi:hypothetical protein